MSNAERNEEKSYLEIINDLVMDIQGLTSVDEKDWVMNKWKKATQALYKIRNDDANHDIELNQEEKDAVQAAFQEVNRLKGQVHGIQTRYQREESGAIGDDQELPDNYKKDHARIMTAIEHMLPSKFQQDKIRDLVLNFGTVKKPGSRSSQTVISPSHPAKQELLKYYFEKKFEVSMREVESLRNKENPAKTEVARLRELETETLPKLYISVAKYKIDTEEILNKIKGE